MPTFALLGATGQIGQATLASLFHDTTHKINAFVRSRSKLETLSPDICKSDRLTIFEGTISDDSNTPNTPIIECLAHTTAVFLTVAEVNNLPGCRIALDTARAVISAITHLKTSGTPYPRRLIMLSSAETDPTFILQIPWLMRNLLWCASSNIYLDLERAETYLRSSEVTGELGVVTTFVKPGGISHDVRRGHVLSTDMQQTFVSFKDVGAGIVQVAVDAEGDGRDGDERVGDGKGKCEWDMKTVSVLSPSGQARAATENLPMLVKGLVIHFVPGLYGWLF